MRRLSCKAKAREVVRDFRPVCCLAKCSIPDDHIDPRRSALFMARSILREVREGFEHADLSAQAGDDDAEDPCRDPDQQRTGLAGGRALRDLRADGLEMAGSRRRPRPEPHAAPLADDADACAGGRPSRLHSARRFSCRSTSGSRWCARSSTRMSLARGSTAAPSWAKPHAVSGTARDIAGALPPEAWQRLSAGSGTKGERLHDWAYLDLADLDADDFNADFRGVWTRGLLIRRTISDGELAFFTTWCPQGTGMDTLVRVEGHRWAIEDSFEAAKNELGLDHNETRSWHGWHRHVSLVMLAFAMMATIRHHANAEPPKKTMRRMPANPG